MDGRPRMESLIGLFFLVAQQRHQQGLSADSLTQRKELLTHCLGAFRS